MTTTDTGSPTRTALRARQAELLAAFDVLDVPSDAELDAVVRVAATVAGVPFGTINLLDTARQCQLATHGFAGADSPREESMCSLVADEGLGLYTTADAAAEPLFAGNPWVDGRRARVRAYASAPLTVDGVGIGSLCVFDEQPHAFTVAERERLADLASVVVGLFERRRQARRVAELAEATEAAHVELERALHELTRAEAFGRALLEELPLGVLAADAGGRVTTFNRVIRDWHGVDARGLAVRDLPEVTGLRTLEGALLTAGTAPLARALAGERVGAEEYLTAPPGLPARRLATSGAPVRDESGTLLGAVVVATDVTEQRGLEEALRAAALHDALTGLPNRSLLTDRLQHALEAGSRTGAPVAVLYCDLDGFKAVNDRFGHGAGDEVLVAAAHRLRNAVRPGDTVARMGGDEFVVLCPGVATEAAATDIADRVTASLTDPVRSSAAEHRIGVSVGVALCRPDDTPDSVLTAADEAMYLVKESRRRR